MLNRELLRYRRRQGELFVRFVDTACAAHLDTAAALLEIYGAAFANQWTRGELAEQLEPLLKGASDPKFAAGLDKLLLDRTEFRSAEETDYPELRRRSFAAGEKAFAAAKGDYRRFCDAAKEAFALDIYGDLPEFERVCAFRSLSAAELLDRYNLALVQGLLLSADKLEIVVREKDPAELRRLFKYLKFFRLLAEIRRIDGDPDGFALSVSGPFSLFENTRRYGVALASFFPALVRLKCWKLDATIRSDERTEHLQLDDSRHLVSHYRNFSAYIPEEIRMFHRLFAEKSPGWQPVGETPFLDGGDQRIIFPDFSFRRDLDGKTVHLELFHRWHAGQLAERLELLDRHPELPLVLGIDRALADSDASFAELLASHPGLETRIMRFRDFPGVANTVKLLDRFAGGAAETT